MKKNYLISILTRFYNLTLARIIIIEIQLKDGSSP